MVVGNRALMLTWRWPLKRPLPFSALCQSRVLLRMRISPTFYEDIAPNGTLDVM